MRGLWLEGGRLTFRSDLPEPRPGVGEALVRVRLAGVCGTDLGMLRGYASFTGVPGHEFVGEVVGRPAGPAVSERVVGRVNVLCHECPECRAGAGRHCRNRQALGIRGRDGAFAEYLALPRENLLAVPSEISDEAAVFVEPLAAAFRILEQAPVTCAHRALVVGAGRLGQLAARVLAMTGCDLRVVARHASQREALAGVAATVVAEEEVSDRCEDLVVEASGSPQGFRLARRAVRPGGTIVLKSTYPGSSDVDLSSLAVDEVRLVGSRCGPFQPAVRALQKGVVDPLALVGARFPLERGVEAFHEASRPGVLKVLIDPAGAGTARDGGESALAARDG